MGAMNWAATALARVDRRGGIEQYGKQFRAAQVCRRLLAVLQDAPMRACVQRVSSARVRVEDEIVGEIGRGFLVLLGVAAGDGPAELRWMVDKVVGLRVFDDGEGKMNLALADVGGELLVVSQFT